MSKAKFKDFYKNSYDWDRTYFECECGRSEQGRRMGQAGSCRSRLQPGTDR